MALANIPLFTFYKLELYRLCTSILVCTRLLTLIVAYLSLSDHGSRLERNLGSAGYGAMIFTLTILTNGSYLGFILLAYYVSGSNGVLLFSATGIWPLLLSLIFVESSTANAESSRRLFLFEIKTRHYPSILLVLFTIFGGFQLSYFLGAGIGYNYGTGFLDFLKPSLEQLSSWERGLLCSFSRRHGWVSGQYAESGLGYWSSEGGEACPSSSVESLNPIEEHFGGSVGIPLGAGTTITGGREGTTSKTVARHAAAAAAELRAAGAKKSQKPATMGDENA